MMNFLTPYHSINYHCYEIHIIADSDVVFDAWTGAILRNNLLYAADKISVEEQTCSLRELVDKFPLAETHPLYKELKEGFPKGYALSGFSHANFESEAVLVRKGEIFTFSLKLIGNFNDYRFYFFEAIRQMCKRGIGKPLTPFTLLDISEKPVVRLADFLASGVEDEFSEITLRYKTPVILFRSKSKKNTQLSYQDKSNRFPGFYQLVRSAFFRLQKLYAVYVEPAVYTPALFEEIMTETYLEKAGYPLLQSADICYVTLQNTQKKEKKNEMPLSGYVGEQVYSGYFQKYLPLLRFMAELGVGNETVYGMGRFEVETKKDDKNHYINVLKAILEEKTEYNDNVLLQERSLKFKKTSMFFIKFKNNIMHHEIPEFRKTVIDTLSGNNMLIFDQTGEKSHYRYPLIQYKRLNGKAAIVCLNEGAESIGEFFMNLREPVMIGNQEIKLELDTVKADKILVQVWDSEFVYSLRKWLPLNSENYEKFQQMSERKEQVAFLEKNLVDNILFFAQGVGIQFEAEPSCSILDMEAKELMKSFASFDIRFKTNVSLPNYIGLGKGVSHGFGMCVRVKN